jgi:hypothetical protein
MKFKQQFVIITVAIVTLGCEWPKCFVREAASPSNEAIIRGAGLPEEDVLSRLIFAEGLSTGMQTHPECVKESAVLFESIGWGVLNRVRMSQFSPRWKFKYGDGILGVVFKRGQFNPAVSARSRFSEIFLCPGKDPSRKDLYCEASKITHRLLASPPGNNPLLQEPWEKKNGVSLINQFYYPLSEQATNPPPVWADPKRKVRNLIFSGEALPENCLWFFRNETN